MYITCVLVTYNSEKSIGTLLHSLLKQTLECTKIIVVDNASKDGTLSIIKELSQENPSINIVSSSINTGGAGGFYLGLKTAQKDNPDFILTFDDDVEIDDPQYIEKLLAHLVTHELDVAGSVVVDSINRFHTAYSYKLSGKQIRDVAQIRSFPDQIKDIKLFNGCLFRATVINQLGGPRPEFFIRGDEQELRLRIKKAGFRIGTSKNALIYHPSMADEQVEFRGHHLIIINHLGKQYFSTRNRIYLYKSASTHEHSWLKVRRILIKEFVRYSYFYLIEKQDFLGFFVWLRAFIDGFTGNLTTDYSEKIKQLYFK